MYNYVCVVNMRPSTSCILAKLLKTCQRCAKSYQEHVGIGDVNSSLFDFAAG